MNINKSILASGAVFLALVTSPAFAEPIGKMLVAVGQVSVSRAGKDLSLTTGSQLESGDVIRSGENSNAQFRLLDGTIMSIRPSTVLSLDDYKFDRASEGKSNRAFFGLLKGGLRTITGLIGKAQPESYRVSTPTSTIGIRGTHYAVRHCVGDCTKPDGSKEADGTFGRVFDGVIFVENQGGTEDFGRDQVFFVPDRNTKPSRLIASPDLLVDRLDGQGRRGRAQNEGQVEGEVLAQSGLSADGRVVDPLPGEPALVSVTSNNLTASGRSTSLGATSEIMNMASAYAYIFGSSTNSSAQKDDDDIQQGSTLASVTSMGGGYVTRNGATLLDTGSAPSAGNISWGRWASPNATVTYPTTGNPSAGVHVAIGDATSSSTIPSSGTVIFSHVGGTNPTNASGGTGTWIAGSLSVDFLTQKMATATAFAWTTGSATYDGVTFNNVSVNTAGNVMVTPSGGTCSGGSCFSVTPMTGSTTLNLNSTYAGQAAIGLILSITTNVGGEYSASVQAFKRP